jgi:hypothetical protein
VKCPNCGITFQITDKTCVQCGIEFLSFYERRAWGPDAKPPKPWELKPPPPEPATPWGRISLLLFAAAATAAWGAWLALARLPPGAAKAYRAGLAFRSPPGWKADPTPSSGWRYERAAELSAPGGRIQIDLIPPATPAAKFLSGLILEEFNGRKPKVEGPFPLALRGKVALRWTFRAEKPVVTGEAVLLDGRKWSFLARFYAEGTDAAQRAADWSAFVGSLELDGSPLALLLKTPN